MMCSNMSVPSLHTLCLHEVVEHIWRNSHLPGALLEVADCVKRKRSGESSILFRKELTKANRKYQQTIKIILKKLKTTEYIPTKLKLKIALSVMRLENDALKSILDLCKHLHDPTKENIAYCIDKLIFTSDCTVDRTATILTIWQHSFMNVDILTNNLLRFCLLPTDMLYELIFIQSCSSDKKQMKKKIFNVITSIKQCDLYGEFKEEAIDNIYPELDSVPPYQDSITFMHIMLYARPEIFRYLYENAPFVKRDQKLVAATVGVLSCGKQNSAIQENILYSYRSLTTKIFLKILTRFYKEIYKQMFFGIFSSTCLEFFNLLLKNYHFKICSDILKFSLELLSSEVPKTCYKNIIYANSKCTFLDMWSQAPDSVKLLLCEGFNDMMDCALNNNDVQLLSIFLNDSAFSNEEKQQHYIHLFSRLVLPSDQDKVNEITEEVTGFEINEIINNINVANFKKILLKICETQCNFEDLVKKLGEGLLINYKIELTKDKQFMIDMITAVLFTSDAENNMKYLFMWLFNNETDAQHYVQKYLVSDLWLADLYKTYLLCTATKSIFPNTDIFKYFNIPGDVQKVIKEMTRNDEKLVCQLCEKYTARKFCQISKLLPSLFDDESKNEQSLLKMQFLESKHGQQVIYQLFKSDYYNKDWYMSFQFRKTIRHYFQFQKQWLGNDRLVRVGFKQLLNSLPHPNSAKIKTEEFNHLEIKRPTKRIPLFHSESVRQNRAIVDANYRMFRSIVSLPPEYRDRACGQFDDDMTGPITEWTESFTTRWLIPLHIPVVL